MMGHQYKQTGRLECVFKLLRAGFTIIFSKSGANY